MFDVTFKARFLLFWILSNLLCMSFAESNRETELFSPNDGLVDA